MRQEDAPVGGATLGPAEFVTSCLAPFGDSEGIVSIDGIGDAIQMEWPLGDDFLLAVELIWEADGQRVLARMEPLDVIPGHEPRTRHLLEPEWEPATLQARWLGGSQSPLVALLGPSGGLRWEAWLNSDEAGARDFGDLAAWVMAHCHVMGQAMGIEPHRRHAALADWPQDPASWLEVDQALDVAWTPGRWARSQILAQASGTPAAVGSADTLLSCIPGTGGQPARLSFPVLEIGRNHAEATGGGIAAAVLQLNTALHPWGIGLGRDSLGVLRLLAYPLRDFTDPEQRLPALAAAIRRQLRCLPDARDALIDCALQAGWSPGELRFQ